MSTARTISKIPVSRHLCVCRAADAARVCVMVDRFRKGVSEDLKAAASALRRSTPAGHARLAGEKEAAKPMSGRRVGGLRQPPANRDGAAVRSDRHLRAQRQAIATGTCARRSRVRLAKSHLPYPGLPPGPIAAPGKGSLEAPPIPLDVDYVYFVSRNDGSFELPGHSTNTTRTCGSFRSVFSGNVCGPALISARERLPRTLERAFEIRPGRRPIQSLMVGLCRLAP